MLAGRTNRDPVKTSESSPTVCPPSSSSMARMRLAFLSLSDSPRTGSPYWSSFSVSAAISSLMRSADVLLPLLLRAIFGGPSCFPFALDRAAKRPAFPGAEKAGRQAARSDHPESLYVREHEQRVGF